MTDWFLPLGTPGSSDEWCFQTVQTAEIQIYLEYQAYFDRLAGLMSQAKKGDEIFLADWAFSYFMVMTQKFGNVQQPSTFLKAALGRGARVRLMMTPSHTVANDNADEVALAVKDKIEAVVDDQLHPNATFHQKSAFIKLEKTAHLFVGGMDVALGRRIPGWFDVQAEIVGLGAHLGRKTLEERWESIKPPLGGVSFTQKSLPTAKEVAHKVQFVRTYPPFPADTKNWKRTYAKAGEHTYYSLLSRAIAKAKTSIYIEEQFFMAMGPAPTRTNPVGGSSPRARSDVPDVPDTLERLLADAIGRGVKVVVVAANRTSVAPNTQFRDTLVKTLTGRNAVLLQVDPGIKFMHSKTWIFDDFGEDPFVVIGSANFWQASLTSVGPWAEGEFGVAFTSTVDGSSLGFKGVTFARALRIKMWERIRQDRDATYKWPRNDKATLDDEIAELRKPMAKGKIVEVMVSP